MLRRGQAAFHLTSAQNQSTTPPVVTGIVRRAAMCSSTGLSHYGTRAVNNNGAKDAKLLQNPSLRQHKALGACVTYGWYGGDSAKIHDGQTGGLDATNSSFVRM